MVQEEFYDSIGWPWRYDPNVGVLIAPALDGEGDGAYRFSTHPVTGGLVTEKNPCPTNASVFQQRRDDSLERVMVLVRASYVADALAMAAEGSPLPPSSDVGEEPCGMDRSEEVDDDVPVPTPLPPRQRLVTNDALKKCVITTHVRPSTGRTDLTVVTPDGKCFRSKVAALRYIEWM